MNDVLTAYEERNEREALERKMQQHARRKEREDVTLLMALPAARRTLHRFITTSGVDETSYRDNPIAMGHACGWQDAARWWLDAIREHCPEREAQMRAEAKREAREGATDEGSNEQ